MPQPVAASVNAAAAQPAKAKKKKILAIIVVGLAPAAIVVVVAAVNVNNAKSKRPDFQALYDEYCSSWGVRWAKVGDDGSYLAIDTNPGDNAASNYGYSYYAYNATKDIDKAPGFDESFLEEMNGTNSLMGARTEIGNGVKVT